MMRSTAAFSVPRNDRFLLGRTTGRFLNSLSGVKWARLIQGLHYRKAQVAPILWTSRHRVERFK
jgi:hypothetical protein